MVRGWLVRNGHATNDDFIDQGPSGNVDIDYSHMPPVDTIPPVRIDPAALERGGDS